MEEVLIPIFQAIGGYIIKEVVNEVGKKIYQVFRDEDYDGEPDDPDTPFATIPDDEEIDNHIIAIDNSGDEVVLEDDCRIDTNSGIYGSLCEVVGVPVTREQENILLCGAVVLLCLGCFAFFKIIHYLFHI